MAHSIVSRQALASTLAYRANETNSGSWRKHATPEAFILESWSEGCMVGALMIMSFVTIANMRRGVLLHKLILLEVFHLSRTSIGPLTNSSSCSPLRTVHSASWPLMVMDGTYRPQRPCCTAPTFFITSWHGSRSDLFSSIQDLYLRPRQPRLCAEST